MDRTIERPPETSSFYSFFGSAGAAATCTGAAAALFPAHGLMRGSFLLPPGFSHASGAAAPELKHFGFVLE